MDLANSTRWDDLPSHLRKLRATWRSGLAQGGVRPDSIGASAWNDGWAWLDSLVEELRHRPAVQSAFYPHIGRASLWLTREAEVNGDEGVYCDPVGPERFRVTLVRRAPRKSFWPETEREIVFEGDTRGAADCLEHLLAQYASIDAPS